MKDPLIAIIVLNWNRCELTLQCLRSLDNLSYDSYRTIVVDNGSQDGSVEAIKSQFPQVELVSLNENLGYARGNNKGLEAALMLDPDWIMFLNNDTEVAPDLLEALMEGLRRFTDGAVFGPKIYYGDKDDVIWYAGGEVSFFWGRTRHRGIREPDRGQYDEPEQIDFVSGCCLLIRADLVSRLGGFDPSYLLYTEDVDLCHRARQQGVACYYIPDGQVWHHISSSIGGELSFRKVCLKWQSGMRFFWRYSQPWYWPFILLYQLFYYGVLGPLRYIRRRRGK